MKVKQMKQWIKDNPYRSRPDWVDYEFLPKCGGDPSFRSIRFYCHLCGERIGTTSAQYLVGGKPEEFRIDYPGQIAHIARQSGIIVEYLDGDMCFRHPDKFNCFVEAV